MALLISSEVRALCGVTKTTLERWRLRWQQTGEVRIVQPIDRGWWHYDEADVREWMQKWTRYRIPPLPEGKRSSSWI
jgi:hypothetical protein